MKMAGGARWGRAVCALGAWAALALLAGCADGVDDEDNTVCGPDRPCFLGTVCQAGFCVPGTADATPGPTPEPEPMTDAATPDAAGAVDAAPIADEGPPSPDAGPPSDASPADATPAIDGAPPEPDMATGDMGLPDDCGRFGEACCPGDVCRNGACLEGTCAQFGGVYAFGGEQGACTVGNPLLRGQCRCPRGFADHALEDVDLDVDESVGISHSVFACLAGVDEPAADLRGAFGSFRDVREGVMCPEACHPGPLSPGCACPEGSTTLAFDGIHYRAADAPDCVRQITFCAGAAPLSFGGVYRQYRPEGIVCNEIAEPQWCDANPMTGACSCPPGFEAAVIGMMAPHKDPARGFDWFCHADTVVCVGTP